MKKRGGLVYSTDQGRMCPKCGRPKDRCDCARRGSQQSGPPSDGVVRVSRQTKGRRGKGVTLVTGVPLAGEELAKLARELKKRCGSGGTLRDGVIEIQGDHRDALVQQLSARGWTVKRSGG
jgi:translation initiation factor 1